MEQAYAKINGSDLPEEKKAVLRGLCSVPNNGNILSAINLSEPTVVNLTQIILANTTAAVFPPTSPIAGASTSAPSDSADSSGHVSVSGGITPHINERTISLCSAGDLTLFTFDGKDSLYYLKLWAKLLKRKKSNYKVVIDTAARKVCFQKAYSPAILWFPMTDVREVRNWYINFRLCGDSFPVFFKHKGTNSLEVESVATPPPELNCLPKYM
eukprot:CAMPEP_0170384252 /NCGR_PEP_ID=MMETSP0117_2-20130122/15901_1 /TAXON_ID=400756 /ORGANISM="Durinskia baltica, Strain CSIRO CS-38" /LENGTH=212 /DNA_ID=CAMNT_0010639993 /DNA_START=16 /DNA_END=654 /DNA_ORIENTATION=-